MKKMMERFKNERGLTLVELLAVVVILAIIGTIAFVLIGNVIENSKKDAHIANAQQLIHAAKLYEAQEGGWPTVTVDDEFLKVEKFLEPLINPWDDSESYTGTVTKDTDAGTYSVTLEHANCKINNVDEETLLKDNREDICNGSGGGNG